GAVAVIPIERGGVVGEIRLENVEAAVAIEISNGGAHASLRATVFVQRGAGNYRDILEGAVAIVVIKDAGRGIAGDKNVGPAVIVVVEGGDAEGVVAVGFFDVRFFGNVLKCAVAAIAVEDILRAGQALRAAHHRNTFPETIFTI